MAFKISEGDMMLLNRDRPVWRCREGHHIPIAKGDKAVKTGRGSIQAYNLSCPCCNGTLSMFGLATIGIQSRAYGILTIIEEVGDGQRQRAEAAMQGVRKQDRPQTRLPRIIPPS